jgi:bifunctional lysine-specific demethylase and histidyl-hydroxylase NO66
MSGMRALKAGHAQGFAPHFDDVDVYVLQVEGAKRWRVYPPLSGHALPRYSSRDFADDEIGAPLRTVVLRPGDLLFLPRGTIHQADALQDAHSMHLTVSAGQRHSWADFLDVAVKVCMHA